MRAWKKSSPDCWRSGGNRIGKSWRPPCIVTSPRWPNTKRAKARAIHLDVGDYVLVGSVSRRRLKLQVRWLGPRRVVQTITDWIFVVEDLRDGKQPTHHVSRMKRFADKDLLVTQDLLDHVVYVEGGHIVKELRDCRFDKAQKIWTVLAK
jgi:hypothetical protein